MSVETSQIKDKNLVLCVCGKCNELISPVDDRGRIKKYKWGHNPSIKKRARVATRKLNLDKKSRNELVLIIESQAAIIKQKDAYIAEMESDNEFDEKIRRLQEQELSEKDQRIAEIYEALLELNPELNLEPQ